MSFCYQIQLCWTIWKTPVVVKQLQWSPHFALHKYDHAQRLGTKYAPEWRPVALVRSGCVAGSNLDPRYARSASMLPSDSGGIPSKYNVRIQACRKHRTPTEDGGCANKAVDLRHCFTALCVSRVGPIQQKRRGYRRVKSFEYRCRLLPIVVLYFRAYHSVLTTR